MKPAMSCQQRRSLIHASGLDHPNTFGLNKATVMFNQTL
jgi:hypothetical protein